MDGDGPPLGDIWSTGAFSFESPLKDLLDSGKYTLEQLLAEDELLQELRGRHSQLMQFFSTERAVQRLIHHVIRKNDDSVILEPLEQQQQVASSAPAEEEGESKQGGQWLFPPADKPPPPPPRTPEEEAKLLEIRYPYMACEVLCCEINSIIDTLVDGHVDVDGEESSEKHEENGGDAQDPRPQPLLDLFFSVLYDTPVGELDDYRAGYFDKILMVLTRKRPKAISTYINGGGGRGPFVLMKTMMKHLYSHSIMQIVQRLLLVHPASFGEEDDDNSEEDDDDDEEDETNFAFRCRWSESPQAVEMLLESLIVPPSEQKDDLRLEESQNASEVLITVIQNSPLTSANMIALTTSPNLERIVEASSVLEQGATFSPHDSSLTSSMNVMESLVLQLGGYGTVGTPMDDQSIGVLELMNGADTSPQNGMKSKQQAMADADTLVKLLPNLLDSLCHLLRHPSTETWLSPTQFAKEEPQELLGMSRLRIVRLLESLVLLGNSDVDRILCETECLSICLDLFWEFQWCSMLHQSVANLLVHVFEGANLRGGLQEYFLVKCSLLGRLLDSFEAEEKENSVQEESNRLSDAVLAMKELQSRPPDSSVESVQGSILSKDTGLGESEEPIPVSEDDVEAALEQQTAAIAVVSDEEALATEEVAEPKPSSTEIPTIQNVPPLDDEENPKEATDVKSHIPSFRMGYMGHVIIICQALVHACSSDFNETEVELEASVATINLESSQSIEMQEKSALDANQNSASSLDFDQDDSDTYDEDDVDALNQTHNPLIIAKLIESSPVQTKWEQFVATTLAAETAIQSTALGGVTGGNPSNDPLHSHCPGMNGAPGYPDDGELPPGEGLLVDGDVIDMDDNDLDIAASMMDAFSNLRSGGRGTDDDVDDENGVANAEGMRPEVAVASFENALQKSGSPSVDYIFDDPLGKSRFAEDDSDDEEEDTAGPDTGSLMRTESSEEDEEDAPVMDLFAGNFSFDKEQSDSKPETSAPPAADDTWSNFANFDDAFAAASASITADIPESAIAPETSDSPVVPGAGEEPTNPDVDEIFGSVPAHTLLIDEDVDVNVESEKPEARGPSLEKEQPDPANAPATEESLTESDGPVASPNEDDAEKSEPIQASD